MYDNILGHASEIIVSTVSASVSESRHPAISRGVRYFFERSLQGSALTPLALLPRCLPRRERVRGLREPSEKQARSWIMGGMLEHYF